MGPLSVFALVLVLSRTESIMVTSSVVSSLWEMEMGSKLNSYFSLEKWILIGSGYPCQEFWDDMFTFIHLFLEKNVAHPAQFIGPVSYPFFFFFSVQAKHTS